jgi:hypothetical protein
MSEEVATNPIEEVVTQPEADEQLPVSESLPVEDDEGEEVEYEGKNYKLPKELKDALLRQSDYTRKTQEVAKTRADVAAERAAAQAEVAEEKRRIASHKENVREYGYLAALDDHLAGLEKTDWQALSDADPIEAQKRFFQASQLKEQRNQIAARITQREQQEQIESQRSTAKALEEGRKVLERDIKGWSSEMAKQVREHGIKSGFTAAEIDAVTDPKLVKALHKSMMYDQLLQKTQAKPKEESQGQEPVKKVSGGTKVSKDPDKMTPDEWLRWRNSQLKKR